MQTSTLRPGYLVVVRTAVRGNVSYTTTDLGTVATVEGEESRWETNRLCRNRAEQDAAVKERALARSAIQTVCSHSDFGMLCPQASIDKLDAAIAKAQGIVDAFNAKAELTSISFNVMCGRIEPDDARAIRAINGEMRDLIEDMSRGMQSLNIEMVRKAANKATSVAKMLEPNAGETVKQAIALAREAARQIKKAGEGAAVEIDQVTLQRLAEARSAFLDVGPVEAIGDVEHASQRVLEYSEAEAERLQAEIEEIAGVEIERQRVETEQPEEEPAFDIAVPAVRQIDLD